MFEINEADIINAIVERIGIVQQASGFPAALIGKPVFIRTITYHYTGVASCVKNGYVTLENAAWIADSGRWADALKTGSLAEVEPYPGETYVSISSIVDACEWSHSLPREQK